jgi:hypothetical protein
MNPSRAARNNSVADIRLPTCVLFTASHSSRSMASVAAASPSSGGPCNPPASWLISGVAVSIQNRTAMVIIPVPEPAGNAYETGWEL